MNPVFKDKHVIFVAVHHVKPAVVLSINNLLTIIEHREDTVLVIIDSASKEGIRDYLLTIRHDRVLIEYLDINAGKAHGVNNFIAKNIDRSNLPKTVWSIDPDILFDQLSFDYLAEAVLNIDKIGMLGMRYKKNSCNPEIYLFFPPKNMVGKNGKTYSVVFPFMANVAGPIFVIPGKLLADPLNFILFPVKYTDAYGPDDAAIYDKLRRHGYKSGYLNGTLVTHLRSADKKAQELVDFMEKGKY